MSCVCAISHLARARAAGLNERRVRRIVAAAFPFPDATHSISYSRIKESVLFAVISKSSFLPACLPKPSNIAKKTGGVAGVQQPLPPKFCVHRP